ncbi:glyoxalase bleomycin resistance protein dioxygenase [Leptolyngbya sp. Heron Island J]|uniref:VOC family protein n=1 Tax=Leptolyngbya sp. Heron Island J TaxID=1385935 RepID=UPI0003B9E8AA|nr:VOC family protein [Leptolyngbya sp. Heron Island J]ESA36231.1 glyoxalase bleomycin resistance protein dioxygenase [Leptolyngbya sp. Heron Island J]
MGSIHPIKIQDAFITLAHEDLQTLVEFYQGLLGQPPQVYIPQRYGEFGLPGLKLALFKPSDIQEFAGSAASMSMCVEVEDLEDAIATLTQLGYPPSDNIIHTSHGQEIYAYDPAGNRLILHQSPKVV